MKATEKPKPERLNRRSLLEWDAEPDGREPEIAPDIWRMLRDSTPGHRLGL
jgi:hypothetical protein